MEITYVDKSNVNKLNILEVISFILFFFVEVNFDLKNNEIIYIASVVLISIIILSGIKKFEINSYLIWRILWLAVVVLSLFYSVNKNATVVSIIKISLSIVVFYLLSMRLYSKYAFYQIIIALLFSLFLNGIYILLNVNLSTLGETAIGVRSLNSNWNSNSIGILYAFGVFLIYFLFKKKVVRKNYFKILFIFLAIFFTIITLFTGSRKSLFILIFPVLFYFFITSSIKTFLLRFIFILLFSFILIQLILNVEPLYTVLGIRIERMFDEFTGMGFDDRSIEARNLLIKTGLRWFNLKPLNGYGMNTFETMYYNEMGISWYAHNNYIELMVGTGIIGLVIYYSFFIFVFIGSIKKKNIDWKIILALFITILIVDYWLVSYQTFIIQFIIFFVYFIYKNNFIDNEYDIFLL